MNRFLVVLCLSVTGFLAAGGSPAEAASDEQTPCGDRVLTARHEASAEFFDFNGDRLECWPRAGTTAEYGDDYPLGTAPPGPESRKFYSWGPDPRRPTSISFVDAATRSFGGFMLGQEDDVDFDGCREMCFETLVYDPNDYFYLDTGAGSTKVTLEYFEQHILGLTRFSMVYSRVPGESSVFSFSDLGDGSAPGQPALRVDAAGTTTVRLAWSPPSAAEGGTPTSYTFGWRSSAGETWSRNYPADDPRITSPFTLTGLRPATAYTITLVALNAAGPSTTAQQTAITASEPAASALPASPRAVVARPGNHRAIVRWRAPVSGAPITAYQVHRQGRTYTVQDPTRRSLTVRGLVNYRKYTFTVRARNAAGWGAWSRGATTRPRP